MSTADHPDVQSLEGPHRSTQAFFDYYANRHESPELLSRFRALKIKALALTGSYPGRGSRWYC